MRGSLALRLDAPESLEPSRKALGTGPSPLVREQPIKRNVERRRELLRDVVSKPFPAQFDVSDGHSRNADQPTKLSSACAGDAAHPSDAVARFATRTHSNHGYHDNHGSQEKALATTVYTDTDPYVDLAERLRWVLEKRGLSARAWSLAAGRSHAQVTMMLRRLEAGETPAFEAEVFEDLARAAQVRPAWLQSGKGTPEGIDDDETDPFEAARRMFVAQEAHEGRAEEARVFLASRSVQYAGAEGKSPAWWLETLRDEFRTWRRPGQLPTGARELGDGERPGRAGSKINARRR